jgi:hypothetical protein
MDIIQKATPKQNGKFVNIHVPGWKEGQGADRADQYDGNEIPW